VLDPRELALEDLAPPLDLPDGELEGAGRVVALGEGQAWDPLVAAPDAEQPLHGRGRGRDVAVRLEEQRLTAGRGGALEVAPEQRLELRCPALPVGRREVAPIRCGQVRHDALRVQLVALGLEGAGGGDEALAARGYALQH